MMINNRILRRKTKNYVSLSCRWTRVYLEVQLKTRLSCPPLHTHHRATGRSMRKKIYLMVIKEISQFRQTILEREKKKKVQKRYQLLIGINKLIQKLTIIIFVATSHVTLQ